MSRKSAEYKYSIGTSRKKWTPRLYADHQLAREQADRIVHAFRLGKQNRTERANITGLGRLSPLKPRIAACCRLMCSAHSFGSLVLHITRGRYLFKTSERRRIFTHTRPSSA